VNNNRIWLKLLDESTGINPDDSLIITKFLEEKNPLESSIIRKVCEDSSNELYFILNMSKNWNNHLRWLAIENMKVSPWDYKSIIVETVRENIWKRLKEYSYIECRETNPILHNALKNWFCDEGIELFCNIV
jgi:hypothetical protein